MHRNKHQKLYINDKAAAWIDALDSGKYQQARECLTDGKGFCCLGVACEIDRDVVGGINAGGLFYSYKDEHERNVLPGEYPEVLGLASNLGEYIDNDDEDSLAYHNDNGYTFTDIARLLKEQPEQFFVKIKGK